jgi:hypothetical protein
MASSVQFKTQVLVDRNLNLAVHEFGKELLILIHLVKEHFDQSVVELKSEVIPTVDLSEPTEMIIIQSIFLELILEESISFREVGTKFLVDLLDDCREFNFLIVMTLIAGFSRDGYTVTT